MTTLEDGNRIGRLGALVLIVVTLLGVRQIVTGQQMCMLVKAFSCCDAASAPKAVEPAPKPEPVKAPARVRKAAPAVPAVSPEAPPAQ